MEFRIRAQTALGGGVLCGGGCGSVVLLCHGCTPLRNCAHRISHLEKWRNVTVQNPCKPHVLNPMLRTGIFTLKVRSREGGKRACEGSAYRSGVGKWRKSSCAAALVFAIYLGGDVYTSVGPMRCVGLMWRLSVVGNRAGCASLTILASAPPLKMFCAMSTPPL